MEVFSCDLCGGMEPIFYPVLTLGYLEDILMDYRYRTTYIISHESITHCCFAFCPWYKGQEG